MGKRKRITAGQTRFVKKKHEKYNTNTYLVAE